MTGATLTLSAGGLLSRSYVFGLANWLFPWLPVAGLYAFVRASGNIVLYIGETDSFARRMPGHDVWPIAQLHRATDVYAMAFNGSDADRKALEKELIGRYNPACNTQHRTDTVDVASILAGLGPVFTPSSPTPVSELARLLAPEPVPGFGPPFGLADIVSRYSK